MGQSALSYVVAPEYQRGTLQKTPDSMVLDFPSDCEPPQGGETRTSRSLARLMDVESGDAAFECRYPLRYALQHAEQAYSPLRQTSRTRLWQQCGAYAVALVLIACAAAVAIAFMPHSSAPVVDRRTIVNKDATDAHVAIEKLTSGESSDSAREEMEARVAAGAVHPSVSFGFGDTFRERTDKQLPFFASVRTQRTTQVPTARGHADDMASTSTKSSITMTPEHSGYQNIGDPYAPGGWLAKRVVLQPKSSTTSAAAFTMGVPFPRMKRTTSSTSRLHQSTPNAYSATHSLGKDSSADAHASVFSTEAATSTTMSHAAAGKFPEGVTTTFTLNILPAFNQTDPYAPGGSVGRFTSSSFHKSIQDTVKEPHRAADREKTMSRSTVRLRAAAARPPTTRAASTRVTTSRLATTGSLTTTTRMTRTQLKATTVRRTTEVPASTITLLTTEVGKRHEDYVMKNPRTTMTKPKEALGDIVHSYNQPRLFCFAVTMPSGYELPLLRRLLRKQLSLFACEEYSVFSQGEHELSDGWFPRIVTEDVGNVTCPYGGRWHLALNTEVFVRIWKKVARDRKYENADWTVKVDPDAVFLPERLRAQVMFANSAARVYLNNCNQGLHGPLEVVSFGAMSVLVEGMNSCEKILKHEWTQWGEDVFLRHCLGLLEVDRVDNFKLLSEDRCLGENPARTGCVSGKVAFHPFKDEKSWFRCYEEAMSTREILAK